MPRLLSVCSKKNDLYRALCDSGCKLERHATLQGAVRSASRSDAVVALADDYPIPSADVGDADLILAEEKDLRIYLEYPRSVPNTELGEPRTVDRERLVVASDLFAPDLPKMSILAMHSCWFLPTIAERPDLVLARVAGYDRAIYGLPAEAHPVLVSLSDSTLIATSKLSHFRTGRYCPYSSWKSLWDKLLAWLTRSDRTQISWDPTVRVSFGRDETLPPDVETRAFLRSSEWFSGQVLFGIERNRGVVEGYQSEIDHEGHQRLRPVIRSDCLAEASMVFAYNWKLTGNPMSKRTAFSLLDYVWSFQQSDPSSPAYGLVDWEKGLHVFYGDDNARVILPTLTTSRLLENDRWDEPVLRCLLANLRTTGLLGFRMDRIDLPDLVKNGWMHYRDTGVVSLSPHYQAYLWACFLWAHLLTGYDGFLNRTKHAIEMTMEAYPDWRWTNGLTQEMARMLLPLAFLVRVEGEGRCFDWIREVSNDLLREQRPCGAIGERLGDLERGQYPPPRSNETYGTTEASIIQENDDPACDLLYTTNFAFLGLHEAASATGDTGLRRAEDKLADFLCRIQLKAEDHPYLSGCWMRSFDYDRWEYWGSSSDVGWGAWSVETGWTNAWIASVLAMRTVNKSMFSLERAEPLRAQFGRISESMLPTDL